MASRDIFSTHPAEGTFPQKEVSKAEPRVGQCPNALGAGGVPTGAP
jgi:hypothetical protein